jgi:hypothetical protein
LAAIAAVVKKVALVLNQDATLLTSEKTDGEMIREGAGGEPDGGFLAECRGHRLFEFGDHSADGVFIRLDCG